MFARSILLGLVLLHGSAGQAQLRIEVPAPPFDTFAEFRDFYVRGSFPATVAHPGNIRVELFKGATATGVPVRILESHVNADGVTPPADLDTAYAQGKAWGGVDASKVPDLVKEPGGLGNPNNKVIVTHSFFAAEVQGGVSKTFDTAYLGADGHALADLEKGTYTVRVTGTSGDLLGKVATAPLHLQYQPKLLGRFAPDEHFQNIKAYAGLHHLRILTDLLPGFFKPDPAGNPTYEIMKRWTPNNAVEIVNFDARAHYGTPRDVENYLILYNINDTCATQQVEIGAILKAQLADNPDRTRYLRYDLGEPEVTYKRNDGQTVTLKGAFVAAGRSPELAVTRIETGMADPGPDNVYRSAEVVAKTVITPASGQLTLRKSSPWVFYGVVPPIPSEVRPVADRPGAYSAVNYVARIHYELKAAGTGATVLQLDKPLGLVRWYGTATWGTAPSLYEFKHVLPAKADLPEGDYELRLSAVDAAGRPVTNLSTRLALAVQP